MGVNELCAQSHAPPSLQVELKAKFVKIQDRQSIVAFAQVKNPGLSVITFPKPSEAGAGPRGSALLVYPLIRYLEVSNVLECDWVEPSAFEGGGRIIPKSSATSAFRASGGSPARSFFCRGDA